MFVNPKIVDFLKSSTDSKDKLTISVYAICKDEIANIEEWIAQFNKCDYICILDTGSTDGTYEKLQELSKTNSKLIIAQKIYNNFHFDEARNDSFELIPTDTDVCITFDFDERLESDWFSTFISMGKEQLLNNLFKVKRNNIIGSDVVSSHNRLFSYPYKCGNQLKWTGFVSESLVNDFSSLKDIQKEFVFLSRRLSNISCNHYIIKDLKHLKTALERQPKYIDYFLYLNDKMQKTDNFYELISLLEGYYIDYRDFNRLLNQPPYVGYTNLIVEKNINHIIDVINSQKIDIGSFENKGLINYIIYQVVCLEKVYTGKEDLVASLQKAILDNSSDKTYCLLSISKCKY